MKQNGQVVYLVDDDPVVRAALSELLESLDFEHISFGSAKEYLDHVRMDSCACLLLDLKMPDVSGLELQQQLGSASGPPIIFISGQADIPSTVRAMKGGATEFLTKPIDPEALVTAIRAAFENDLKERQLAAELAQLQRRYLLLTPRERDVLPLLASGLLNKQSAAILGISEVTLQVHRGQIMRKMEAASFADLIRMAGKLGIPAPECPL